MGEMIPEPDRKVAVVCKDCPDAPTLGTVTWYSGSPDLKVSGNGIGFSNPTSGMRQDRYFLFTCDSDRDCSDHANRAHDDLREQCEEAWRSGGGVLPV